MRSPDQLTEQELVQACLRDHRPSQEFLYRQYADEMYNICLIYALNEDDACDILQDAFIRIFKNLQSFRFESALRTWIRQIVVHNAINFYKKQKAEREWVEPLQDDLYPEPNTILEKLQATEVINLVNQLPSKAQLVLKLYAIEGYKHQEIAQLLDISEGTSKSQLNRAKLLLRQLIDANK